jgi:RNA polymerase sigma factor (sigma-70 family)
MALTMSRISRPPVSSEQALVAASREGDDRAFEELYARYRERIFSFILSKVHDHGRAEDIAQEVFMSALRRLRSSDQAISFKPWIYEIAKNACIDEFRRGSRAREVPLESDGEFVVDRQAAAVSAAPTPPAAVESKQRLNDLRGAFGGLSASHHQLLVMREFEGLSYDEIGERLDMTRQMVESSLFRARRKLTEEYQELASGQRCEQIQTAIDDGRLRSVSGLGIRDRRRFARHLSHCQPCRHAALMAGVDEALVKPRSIAAKIAALLPFPLWRLPWRSGAGKASRAGGSHQMAGASSAGLAGSAGSAITFGQAAATVAVIVAGAGGGLAVNSLASGGHSHPPAAAARHSGRSTGAGSSTGAGAARAAHGHAVLRPGGATALSINPRSGIGSHPGSARRQRGSASGGPGGNGGAGSNSAAGNGGGSAGSGAASAVKKTTNGLTNTANGATKTVNGVANTVGKTVNGVTNTVGKTLNGVTNTVGSTVNGATNTVGKTVNGAANTVGSTVNGAANTVSKTVNGVTQATGTATTPVGQAVNGAANTVGQAAGGATSGVTQTTSGATNTVSNTVNGVTGGLSKTVSGVTGGLTGGSGGSTGSSSPSSSQTATSSLQQSGSILGH